MVLVRVFLFDPFWGHVLCFSNNLQSQQPCGVGKIGGFMAIVKCAICGDEVDSEHYGVKQCAKCSLWFCYKHCGQYKSQCIVCKEYALKNKYGR